MCNKKKSMPIFIFPTEKPKETLLFQKDTTKVMTIPKDSKHPELHGELFLG
nr:MAG: hypothetical protein [Bacteriophage sp.]